MGSGCSGVRAEHRKWGGRERGGAVWLWDEREKYVIAAL